MVENIIASWKLPLDFPALTSRPSSPLRSKSTSPRPSKLVLASSPGSFSSISDTLYSPRSAQSGTFYSTSGTLSGFEDNLGDQEVDIVDIFGGIKDIGGPDLPELFGGMAVVRQAFLKPSHVPAQQVIRLFKNAGEFLQYANLRGSCHVPATSLSLIAKHSPHISHLDLQGCTSLTGTALVQILSGLRRLKTVDLAGHPDLIGDDDDADRPVQTGIVKLHLPQIPGLDDTALAAIGKRGCLLETLEVAGMRGVSDTALDSLSSCVQLRHLDVEECISVWDVGLGVFLWAGGNDRVAGVAAVLGGCRALKTLDLSGCGGITDGLLERVVAMIVRARTPLRIVGVGVMAAADSGWSKYTTVVTSPKRRARTSSGVVECKYEVSGPIGRDALEELVR
ncbi:RNI-like protein [Gonapodya prolifera JEL478]|uniref:RNI-like protein n=1 Tax=Gonapodya prolifera (strain JEL478) TaxID=1344416 RepID=A0A139ACC9_GONPJ|nr:RNI-like protein [Gonapodya prolifera JEL478]|eukprot:KXS14427.1 RNI-like protein [Gonapodya prolifera JEL478]